MNELRQIDMNLLLTLHALLREKHVTRAAAHLYKSQPAVSHALAQLRDHFDDPLLVRRNGRMHLTSKAQSLLLPLEEALDDLNQLLRPGDFSPAQITRRFRCGLSDYASRVILPPLVGHLRQHAPGIDLAVTQSSREGMLLQVLEGELDLAFGIFHTLPADVQSSELFRESFLCVADKALLAGASALTLTQWIGSPHVRLSLLPDVSEEIEKTLSEQGLRRHISVSLPHWGTATELLPGTDLILTIAARAVDIQRLPERLVAFPPPLPLPELRYQMVWHQRRERDAAQRWLQQTIRDLSVHF